MYYSTINKNSTKISNTAQAQIIKVGVTGVVVTSLEPACCGSTREAEFEMQNNLTGASLLEASNMKCKHRAT